MKKLCLVAGILSFSAISFAQQKSPKTIQLTDTVAKLTVAPEDRFLKLETEVANLRSSQTEIEKQLAELKTFFPELIKKKKPVVTRFGSKQVNWSKE